jgi:hypothetical protein
MTCGAARGLINRAGVFQKYSRGNGLVETQ